MENINFIQLKHLDDLYKLPKAPAEGTIFKIQDTEQFYLISNDGTPLLIKGMTDEILENKESTLSFFLGANSNMEKWAEIYKKNKKLFDEILENKMNMFSICSNSDGEEWVEPHIEVPEEDAFVTGMTLYELNKNLMSQMTPLDDNELYKAGEDILAFCEETKNEYYMLLCHELRYFTLFNYYVVTDRPLPNIEEEVIACAHDIGSIVSVENKDDAIEIWIKTEDDEVYVMYFFPYDRGVIKCQ